jgi:hypothetical protein
VTAATAGVEQLGDLVEGEPEPLRRLHHPQQRHRLVVVLAMPAQGTPWFGEQAAAFVVAQGLHVHPGRDGQLT